MKSLNKVQLIGNITADPEMKYTQNGKAVCPFSVATDESYTDSSGVEHKKAEFHRIVSWGKIAEVCGKYLKKGSRVYVEGSLTTRKWEDRDGNTKYTTEVQLRNMIMLGGKKSSDGDVDSEHGGKEVDEMPEP